MTYDHDPRLQKLTLVCVGVCTIVGPIVGLEILGIMAGRPQAVLMVDIAGAPFVIYALISTAVPGTVAGVVASRTTSAFIARGFAAGHRRRAAAPWVGSLIGGLAGVVLGVALGVLYLPQGGDDVAGGVKSLCVASSGAGASCGLLIATWVLWATRPTGSARGHVSA